MQRGCLWKASAKTSWHLIQYLRCCVRMRLLPHIKRAAQLHSNITTLTTLAWDVTLNHLMPDRLSQLGLSFPWHAAWLSADGSKCQARWGPPASAIRQALRNGQSCTAPIVLDAKPGEKRRQSAGASSVPRGALFFTTGVARALSCSCKVVRCDGRSIGVLQANRQEAPSFLRGSSLAGKLRGKEWELHKSPAVGCIWIELSCRMIYMRVQQSTPGSFPVPPHIQGRIKMY